MVTQYYEVFDEKITGFFYFFPVPFDRYDRYRIERYNRYPFDRCSRYPLSDIINFMRELGIILFLACVGLLSGEHFVETIVNGGWRWMIYGTAITFIPLLIAGAIGRFLKVNYLKLCGCIAGSMTDPPALEFANSIAPVQAQATAYATVYPLTMFLRVLLAQIFVLMTLG